MFSLDLSNIIYLAFRLGPFVLVSYFMMLSIFSQDFKSIIYLAGLVFACFIVTLISALPLFSRITDDSPYICNQITLAEGAPLSTIPLSTVVYIFTFSYLLMAMFYRATSREETNAIAANHIPILVLFPLIIVIDIAWITVYSCANLLQTFSALVLGGGLGTFWAFILAKSNMSALLYMTVMSNAQVCQRATKTKMRCKMKSTHNHTDASGNKITQGMTD